MKKWTEAYPRDNAIVDYKEFNKGYNAMKGTINGGIDRTIMPKDLLDEDNLVAGAFQRSYIVQRPDMSTLTDTSTGALGNWRGLSYNTYGGGWVTVDDFEVTDFKDGMCHWEFSFHYQNNVFHSDNAKALSIKLLIDGVEVCNLYKIAEPIGSFTMVCDFPVTAGNHTVEVQARGIAPSADENNENLFNLVSMQHLIIGRWRSVGKCRPQHSIYRNQYSISNGRKQCS
jgi:hypothetical protein